MQTLLLLLVLIVLSLDFYIKHEKLVKKIIRDILKKVNWTKSEFSINKKWVGDKIKEELKKETNLFYKK